MEAKIRLIPAGAGTSRGAALVLPKRGSSPQVRENEHVRQNGTNICGSSPQVRGKQWAKEHEVSLGRLIPAGAGKTGARHESQTPNAAHPRRCGKTKLYSSCHALPSAHPRRCGENSIKSVGATSPFGSSPQVRGKQEEPYDLPSCPRLIPAGAGKTRLRWT